MKLFDAKKPDNKAYDAPTETQQDDDILERVEEQHRSSEGVGKFMRHPVQVLTKYSI